MGEKKKKKSSTIESKIETQTTEINAINLLKLAKIQKEEG